MNPFLGGIDHGYPYNPADSGVYLCSRIGCDNETDEDTEFCESCVERMAEAVEDAA